MVSPAGRSGSRALIARPRFMQYVSKGVKEVPNRACAASCGRDGIVCKRCIRLHRALRFEPRMTGPC